jgi:putative transposase
MADYRRDRTTGGTYFFTVVTAHRRNILIEPEARDALRETISSVRNEYPFKVEAWVLLPDHLHCIWTLPEGDADFSKRWGLIKAGFSKRTRSVFYEENLRSSSRRRHKESTVWQRRFWEHRIRDEQDFERHVNYIHYNPVKHGLVKRARDWPYSTFHRYVKESVYPVDWGGGEAAYPVDGFGE